MQFTLFCGDQLCREQSALARSLAGRPVLRFRTSRDICEKADTQERLKSPHRILRREFYIECSCGYRGLGFDNDCPKCAAQPAPSIELWTGLAPEMPEVAKKSKTRSSRQRVLDNTVPAPTPSNPNSVRCECGAIIAAESRDKVLEVLAEHKRAEHPMESQE
jgi:hypothetical protein